MLIVKVDSFECPNCGIKLEYIKTSTRGNFCAQCNQAFMLIGIDEIQRYENLLNTNECINET